MKKIIDILAIVLPALLILFALLRNLPAFKKYSTTGSVKTPAGAKILNALAILFLIVLLLGGITRYLFYRDGGNSHSDNSKAERLAVSKHTDAFNESVQSVLNAYYEMSDGFVKWDAPLIDKYANQLKIALDSFKIEELKADTIDIYNSALDPLANAKAQTDSILHKTDLAEKRTALNSLSENLRLLLIVVQYDANKVYWQECPMAFGEDNPGNWLSKSKEVRNPYLGLKHPQYKDGMLECGGPKDTIDFMIPDTTKKL